MLCKFFGKLCKSLNKQTGLGTSIPGLCTDQKKTCIQMYSKTKKSLGLQESNILPSRLPSHQPLEPIVRKSAYKKPNETEHFQLNEQNLFQMKVIKSESINSQGMQLKVCQMSPGKKKKRHPEDFNR